MIYKTWLKVWPTIDGLATQTVFVGSYKAALNHAREIKSDKDFQKVVLKSESKIKITKKYRII